MERLKKRNKGITLIALVVTIVVLLILAAISIEVFTGDNGIINNAKKSKEDTEIAEEKEILNVSVTQAVGEDAYGNLEEDNFREKLNENAEGTQLEKIGYNYKVTFPSERKYTVTGDGQIHKIDSENTVELVARLVYDYDYKEGYVIGVGFEDYQLDYDGYRGFLMNLIKEKNEQEKEELFIELENEYEGTNFRTLGELFEYFYNEGYTETLMTSLEELVRELYSDPISVDIFLFEKMRNNGYKFEDYEKYILENEISGTLKAPNGEEYRIYMDDIIDFYNCDIDFEQYCYKYPINQNGEYTFTFIGNDGRYGEITLEINNEIPQIVSCHRFNRGELAIILGLDNFVDMEEASFEIIGINDETINLTQYISNNMYGFQNNVIGIDLADVSEFYRSYFEGKFTCKYKGQEISLKQSCNFGV